MPRLVRGSREGSITRTSSCAVRGRAALPPRPSLPPRPPRPPRLPRPPRPCHASASPGCVRRWMEGRRARAPTTSRPVQRPAWPSRIVQPGVPQGRTDSTATGGSAESRSTRGGREDGGGTGFFCRRGTADDSGGFGGRPNCKARERRPDTSWPVHSPSWENGSLHPGVPHGRMCVGAIGRASEPLAARQGRSLHHTAYIMRDAAKLELNLCVSYKIL